LITRTRRLQSSFEKLEKSVGVELDLLGKEKPKNALNDDSPCPAMVISKKMSISLVKAVLASHFLLSRLHLRCMFYRAFLRILIAGRTHAEGREHVPVAVSSGRVTMAMPTTAIQRACVIAPTESSISTIEEQILDQPIFCLLARHQNCAWKT
jgi:hypothetical protein